MVFPLPYSEHSSVEELRRFVQMVRNAPTRTRSAEPGAARLQPQSYL